MTKRMLLVGLQSLQRQFGLRYLHLIPSTLYGPNYHTTHRQLHFIFDLIRKIIHGKQLGKRVVLWGDGHQTRELVFIGDFVHLMLELTEQVDNETINVGAGQDHSIRDFAQRIAEMVGYDANQIEYDTTRYVGVRTKCLRNEKLLRLLPDSRFTPLDEGLRSTIAWMERETVCRVATVP